MSFPIFRIFHPQIIIFPPLAPTSSKEKSKSGGIRDVATPPSPIFGDKKSTILYAENSYLYARKLMKGNFSAFSGMSLFDPSGFTLGIKNSLQVTVMKRSIPIYEVFFTVSEWKQEKKKVIQGRKLIMKSNFQGGKVVMKASP